MRHHLISTMILSLLSIGFGLLMLNSCKEADKSSKSFEIPFTKEGTLSFFLASGDTVQIDIEVANTELEITNGLMYRKSMPESSGMLFVFEQDEPRSFWMKNTYLSLDMIFVKSDLQIASIYTNIMPLRETGIPSGHPVQYVIEVPAGFSYRHKIAIGDYIDFSIF